MNARFLLILLAVVGLLTAVLFWNQIIPDAVPMPGSPNDPPAAEAPDLGISGNPAAAVETSSRTRRQAIVDTAGSKDPVYTKALSGFRGRVVDSLSQPVADCMVRFFRLDPMMLQSPNLFAAELEQDGGHASPKVEVDETLTQANGEFLLSGVWPRAFYLCTADADGDNRTTRLVEQTPGPGEIVDLGDIQLANLGVIVGQVMDANEQPVVGAQVQSTDLPAFIFDMSPIKSFDPEGVAIIREDPANPMIIEFPAWVKKYHDMLPIPMTTTDAQGRFRLLAVPPGQNVVLVQAREQLPLAKKGVRVRAGQEKDVGIMQMKAGEQLQGRVVEGEDQPVAGAQIIVASSNPMFPVDLGSFVGTSDAEGYFQTKGLPPTTVSVAARRDAGQPWVVLAGQPVDGDIKIQLPSSLHLTLKLTDHQGQLIKDAQFKLLPTSKDAPLDLGSLGLVKWLDLKKRVQKTEDGHFRISKLIPGTYSLAVKSPGHAAGKLDFQLQKNMESELALQAEVAFQLQVVNAQGEPVQHAAIYLKNTVPGGRKMQMMEMPILAGHSNAQGKLRVDDAAAGKVKLSAIHPAYGISDLEFELPTDDVVRIQMATPGSITGVLTEAGRQPTPGKWTLAVFRDWSNRREGAMPDMPLLALADLEGKFSVQGLRPGKYRVMVISSMAALTSPGGMATFMMKAGMQMGAGRGRNSEQVEVASNANSHVELDAIQAPEAMDGPSAPVSGTVMINGRPADGMLVTGWGRRSLMATVDANGRFELGEVKTGKIGLQLRDPSGESGLGGPHNSYLWQRYIEVKEGEPQLLDITLDTGALAGLVLKLDGSPAAGVRVQMHRQSEENDAQASDSNFTVLTNAQGRFELAKLPAGNYELNIMGKENGYAQLTGVEVLAGGSVTGIILRLTKVMEVSGNIDLSFFGDTPPENVYLALQHKDRAAAEGDRVKKDGSFKISGLPEGSYSSQIYVWGRGAGRKYRDGKLSLDQELVIKGQDLQDLQLGIVFQPRDKNQEEE